MKRLVLSGTVLAAILSTALALSPRDGRAQATTIDVGSDYFCAPSFENSVCETTITSGSTLTWQVSSGVHTVTQCDASFATCPPQGGFDSGLLSGGTYSQTFNSPGTIAYYCAFHPDQMRGRILVQAQPTAAPIPSTPGPGQTAAPTSGATSAPGATSSPAQVPAGGGTSANESPGTAVVIAAGILLLALLTGAGTLSVVQNRSDRRED